MAVWKSRKPFLLVVLGFCLANALFALDFLLLPKVSNSHDLLAERGILALGIERPRHVPPREWHSQGGMNPIDFWSWAPDPSFAAKEVQEFQIEFDDGSKQPARSQLLFVNPTFDDPRNRERVLAIESGGAVYEFTLPESEEAVVLSDVEFLAISEGWLIFLYSESLDHFEEFAPVVRYIIKVPLPLVSQRFEVVGVEAEEWPVLLSLIRARADPFNFDRLCDHRNSGVRYFVQVDLGVSCP